MKQTYILVKTTFEGYHRWPNAPEVVGFLKNLHRHLFTVTVGIEVHHGDRELEFFMVKQFLDTTIPLIVNNRSDTYSCEDICDDLIQELQCKYGMCRGYCASVMEDGENGAQVNVPFVYIPAHIEEDSL